MGQTRQAKTSGLRQLMAVMARMQWTYRDQPLLHATLADLIRHAAELDGAPQVERGQNIEPSPTVADVSTERPQVPPVTRRADEKPIAFWDKVYLRVNAKWWGAAILAVAAVIVFGNNTLASFLQNKQGLYDPKPRSETEIPAESRLRIEERFAELGPAGVYEIRAAADFSAPLTYLDSMTEKPGRFNLSPMVVSMRVTGPAPGQAMIIRRLNAVAAIEYVQGLQSDGKYPLVIEIFHDGFLHVNIDAGPVAFKLPKEAMDWVADGGTLNCHVEMKEAPPGSCD